MTVKFELHFSNRALRINASLKSQPILTASLCQEVIFSLKTLVDAIEKNYIIHWMIQNMRAL